MNEKRRFDEVTILNALLCLGVIVIHLTSIPVEMMDRNTLLYLLSFSLNRFLIFCVPSFIFLSGMKLYNKYKDGLKAGSFYLNRAGKILLPYLVAVTVFFLYFYSKGWASVSELPRYFFLGTIASHFYYIVISVQLYLLFPLILWVYKRVPLLTLLLSLMSTILFKQYLLFPYSDRFFGSYIFFFVLGMCFVKYNIYERISKYMGFILPLFAVAGVFHVDAMYLSTLGRYYYARSEIVNTIYVTLAVATLLFVGNYLKNCPFFLKISRAISAKSYSVYLYHCLVISVVKYDVFPYFNWSVGVKFAVASIVTFGAVALYCLIRRPAFLFTRKLH